MTEAMGMMKLLPPEIRGQIFTECILHRSIGLLAACRDLYSELQCFLHEKFVLILHVIPAFQQSQIWIVKQPYQQWGIRRSIIHVASAHLHPDNDYLAMMPLHRFKMIRILIDAPDPQDPGQMVRLHKEMSALVTMLSPSWRAGIVLPNGEADIAFPRGKQFRDLPLIEVELRKAGKTSWTDSVGLSWNQSLDSHHDFCDENGECLTTFRPGSYDAKFDVEIALHPLLRLRHAKGIRFQIRGGKFPHEPRVLCLFRHIQGLAIQKQPYGLRWDPNPENIRSDYIIQVFESCTFLWLDYLLDELSGPSAEYLRIERFRQWCTKYEDHFFTSILGVRPLGAPDEYTSHGGARVILSDGFVRELVASMSSRYWTRHCHAWPHAAAGQPKSRHRFWSTVQNTPTVPFRVLGMSTGVFDIDSKCYACYQAEDGVKVRCIGNRGVS